MKRSLLLIAVSALGLISTAQLTGTNIYYIDYQKLKAISCDDANSLFSSNVKLRAQCINIRTKVTQLADFTCTDNILSEDVLVDACGALGPDWAWTQKIVKIVGPAKEPKR